MHDSRRQGIAVRTKYKVTANIEVEAVSEEGATIAVHDALISQPSLKLEMIRVIGNIREEPLVNLIEEV